MSVQVALKGFETVKQAKAFVSWLSGQGEQQADDWLLMSAGFTFTIDHKNDAESDYLVVSSVKIHKD
jgi:hypothetical protein